MTLYLHIGLHKTGTSSLQAFLKRNREKLATLGYAYPEVGWVLPGAHHNPAYELLGKKRFDPAAGTLDQMLASLGEVPNAIVSSEEWEFLNVAQCERLRAAVGDRRIRIIVYLRRQDALIGSTYAQQVKMGAHLNGFAGHVRSALYDSRFDFPQLLGRWAHVFGPENLDAVVITPENAGARLYDDFLARVGLSHASGELSRPLRLANESPGWAAVELIRMVTEHLRPGRKLHGPEMKAINAACIEWVAERPQLAAAGRVTLSNDDYARVAARFGAGNAYAAARFIGGVGQAEALAFPTRSGPEPTPPDHASLAEAARALADKLAAHDPRLTLTA